MNNLSPNIKTLVNKYDYKNIYPIKYMLKNTNTVFLNSMPMKSFNPNFYGVISSERNSKTIIECAKLVEKNLNNFFK